MSTERDVANESESATDGTLDKLRKEMNEKSPRKLSLEKFCRTLFENEVGFERFATAIECKKVTLNIPLAEIICALLEPNGISVSEDYERARLRLVETMANSIPSNKHTVWMAYWLSLRYRSSQIVNSVRDRLLELIEKYGNLDHAAEFLRDTFMKTKYPSDRWVELFKATLQSTPNPDQHRNIAALQELVLKGLQAIPESVPHVKPPSNLPASPPASPVTKFVPPPLVEASESPAVPMNKVARKPPKATVSDTAIADAVDRAVSEAIRNLASQPQSPEVSRRFEALENDIVALRTSFDGLCAKYDRSQQEAATGEKRYRDAVELAAQERNSSKADLAAASAEAASLRDQAAIEAEKVKRAEDRADRGIRYAEKERDNAVENFRRQLRDDLRPYLMNVREVDPGELITPEAGRVYLRLLLDIRRKLKDNAVSFE